MHDGAAISGDDQEGNDDPRCDAAMHEMADTLEAVGFDVPGGDTQLLFLMEKRYGCPPILMRNEAVTEFETPIREPVRADPDVDQPLDGQAGGGARRQRRRVSSGLPRA